jgi:monofunctional biosynthetic peptidoglycan transglycosylase
MPYKSTKDFDISGSLNLNRGTAGLEMAHRGRYNLKKPPTKHKTSRRCLDIACISFCIWLLIVLIYRIVPPLATPLMAIRYVQAAWNSDVGFRSWEWTPLRALPAFIPQAIVTAEDARFIEHWGVDISAVGAAIDAADGRSRLRGASTITMQTVKNLFLWPGRSYVRKFIEFCMAPVAGVVWGKRRTLELYINVIEWGQGIYGIESAARHYFKKSASKLSVSEAAALAAILPNPRKLSPIRMVHSTRRRYERILREYSSTRLP